MNVQQIIIQGIKEQLFYHDYLVLPNFGGFVLKSKNAHVSGSGIIFPPSKTVSFNAQLKQNDGILALWLQDKLSCTAAESVNHLKEFADFCSGILSAKRRLTLDSIGFFYLDFENNLCFEPQQDANFLPDSFGLGAVSIAEIQFVNPEVKKETVFVDRTLHTTSHEPGKKASFRYRTLVAPAAILVALFGLLALFVSNTRMSGQLRASLTGNYTSGIYKPVTYPELNLLLPEKQNTTYVTDANGVAVFELSEKKSIAVKAMENLANTGTAKSNVTKLRKHSSGTYEIVLGCFGVLDNAKRMADKLKKVNIDAVISEKNDKGLYTVSNGSFSTKDEAQAGLTNIQREFPKAWIKTR